MATIYTTPSRIPEMIYIHRSGGRTGVSREDWAKPVKSFVKPRPLPVRTDNSYAPPVPFEFTAEHKASGFVESCKLFAVGYFGLMAVIGLYNLLNYLF